jgi:hypothetical protein
MRILVLYRHLKGPEMLLAVRQHLHVMDSRGLRIIYRNTTASTPPWLAWTAPDLCLLHTTFLCARWQYDFEEFRRMYRWVSALPCPKVALPQDEYDHAEVLDEWLCDLGVTSVYSCFGADKWGTLYPRLGQRAALHETLTGFIDEQAAAAIAGRICPHAQRPYDIVYRARNLPYWFGSHGQLKHRIADAARDAAGPLGLRTDISTREEDTVYGDGWLDFLMSGRAVIGVESGSSVLDARGQIRRRISQLLAEEPNLTFDEVDARMPAGWDSYAFFAVSPRHLEAVITKTAQVLVEGRYSCVLEPERHYIPVRCDLSNLDEALARLEDVEAVEAMTERAYRDVYLSGRNNLSAFADQIYAEAAGRRTRHVALPFALLKSPMLPVPRRTDGIPVRLLISVSLTFVEVLARQREARDVLLAIVRGRLSIPLRDAVRELVLLRILARIGEHASEEPGAWSLSVNRIGGAICIRTCLGAEDQNNRPELDGPLGQLAWNHVDVAVPVYPRHRRWGWIWLGQHGRYEFPVLVEVARTDPRSAHVLLARALGRVSSDPVRPARN